MKIAIALLVGLTIIVTALTIETYLMIQKTHEVVL